MKLTRKSQMHIRFGRRKKMDDGGEVSDIAPKPEKPRKASRVSMRRPTLSTPSFMSKASMPKPVAGVVDDLRERGLLPVALVLIAAIVAVPFVLSSGAKPPPEKNVTVSAQQAALAAAPETQPVVLRAGESIRDYKKRLDESASKNPFEQQFTGAPPTAGGDSGTSTGGGSTTPTTGGDTGGSTGAPTGGGTDTGSGTGSATGTSPGGGSSTGTTNIRNFHWEIDAFVGDGTGKLKHKRIGPAESIPNQKTPVAIFVGVTNNGKTAMFAVSSQVTAVTGEIDCPLSDNCSLIRLDPGKTAKFAYAPDGKTYTLKFIRAEVVSKAVSGP